MNKDTRVAVIAFLFYTFNGVVNFSSGFKYVPPLYLEAAVLTLVSLIFFVLTLPRITSFPFLLFAYYFVAAFLYPVLPQEKPDLLQYSYLAVPLLNMLWLYASFVIGWNDKPKRLQFYVGIHLFFVLISFIPAYFAGVAWMGLAGGIGLSLTSLFMLSDDQTSEKIINWQRRLILMLLLIVYMDLVQYLFLYA